MIFIQIIAAELGLAVLLLAIMVVLEVHSNIEFRKHQSSSPMGGMKFIEMMGGGPPPGTPPEESEEGEKVKESGGTYL